MISSKGQHIVLFFLLNIAYSCARSPLLQSIVTRLVPGENYNSLFWIKNKNQISDILDEEDVQLINLDAEVTSKMATVSLKALHVRHEKTLIFVDEPAKISDMFFLASNQRHVLVFVHSQKPPQKVLYTINAPLVWVQNLEDGVRPNLIIIG